MLKLKELSFLVYGMGLSGHSVIRFFKKNKIKNFKVWDDNKKKLIKEYKPKKLHQTLKKVDYIILAPGISLLKNNHLILRPQNYYFHYHSLLFLLNILTIICF